MTTALEGDREHQPAMVLAGVNMPDAEHDREQRHRCRHAECGVLPEQQRLAAGPLGLQDQIVKTLADRLELKRDVGKHAKQRGERHEGRQHLTLAVARGDEVRDRGDVLRLRDRDHLGQQPLPEQQHQGRADIDRGEVQTAGGGAPDRPVEAPRGVVDRKRQAIADRGRPGVRRNQRPAGAPPVAPPGNQEQRGHIAGSDRKNEPRLQDILTRDRPIRPRRAGPERGQILERFQLHGRLFIPEKTGGRGSPAASGRSLQAASRDSRS
ncbi:hypothetical protein AB7M17_007649 [Bradyrhizobium sp. USDA 377]